MSADNAVIHDSEAFRNATSYAEQLLSELSCLLRGSEAPVGPSFADAGSTMIEGRTRYRVDATDSFDASSILFDAVVTELAAIVPSGEAGTKVFRRAVTVLERSITARTKEYFLSYLAHLSDKVQLARSDERRRIARDLHDRIGHGLSATQLQLELYDLYRDTDPPAAAAKVDTARRAIQESIHNLRSITSDLHCREPVTSLTLALMAFAEAATPQDVDVSVRVGGNESRIGPEVMDESFLILREALRNALRHAKASVVLVDVTVAQTELVASVTDDGVGFVVDDPPDAGGGMGLTAMAERAALLDGAVVVSSEPGQGTLVHYRVPLGVAGE